MKKSTMAGAKALVDANRGLGRYALIGETDGFKTRHHAQRGDDRDHYPQGQGRTCQ